jgi:hypothetical protein
MKKKKKKKKVLNWILVYPSLSVQSSKLLLALASTVVLGFGSRRDSMTMFLFFPGFYVF